MDNNNIVEQIKNSPGTLQAIRSYRKAKGITGHLTEYDYGVLMNSHHCGRSCDKALLVAIMELTQARRLKVLEASVAIGDAIIPRSKHPSGDAILSVIQELFGSDVERR